MRTQPEEQLVIPWPPALSGSEALAGTPRRGLTFRDSRQIGIHRWYPYVEGFSAPYVRELLGRRPIASVLDPFGGAGTTQLEAALLGIPSFSCEVNPFMAFVADTKIRAAGWARDHFAEFSEVVRTFVSELAKPAFEDRARQLLLDGYAAAFPGRDFFQERDLRHLLASRDIAFEVAGTENEPLQLLLLACAANAVGSSNMTRRADLRRRRADEYKARVVDVRRLITELLRRMYDDIRELPGGLAPTTMVSDDCRAIPDEYDGTFDLAITSPPYLNGTNYFRNTKIELWLLGFISTEVDLAGFRDRAVAGGINNISGRRQEHEIFPVVERVAERLDGQARDRRIPELVRHYFSDMSEVLNSIYRAVRPGAEFVLDIGDSKFYGVHVPTDDLLIDVAERIGWSLERQRVLARRLSYDKSPLVQVELTFRKPEPEPHRHPRLRSITKPDPLGKKKPDPLGKKIEAFGRDLPYRRAPYSGRAWGHAFHSLCSYQGKIKPSIAHWLIQEFVREDDAVLDPLGGVGTIPLEASLLGRRAISNDKSPFAAMVAAAKLDPPSLDEAEEAIRQLEAQLRVVELTREDHRAAEFGLNASVCDYYHPDTLEEVLRARRIFLDERASGRAKAFIWASLLHVLHGNRPYALSCTSHPITPFSPTGEATYKSVIEHVRMRVQRALRPGLPATFRRGTGLEGDFRDLPAKFPATFDAVITSPPFPGMRFDRPNWLRLWFCGWTEDDFHKTSRGFLERQQQRSHACYADLFAACRAVLKPGGLLVLHVGGGGHQTYLTDLCAMASEDFDFIGETVEDVQSLEQHGIRDKGLTKTHHLLFFRG